MKYYEQNRGKISELLPEYQYAGFCFIDAADSEGLDFRITEAYRSQERQNQLFAQVPKVTWTLNSNHTRRAAFDVVAINCSYEQIEKVANKFGLFRDPALVKLGDLGHFDCFLAIQHPSEPKYTPQAIARGFQRLIKRTQSALQKKRLQDRLNSFLSQ